MTYTTLPCINKSGYFKTTLQYRLFGDGDDYGCVAWALNKSGEKLESTKITIKMAKSEGWYSKNKSKWQTMPEQMLKYRAAAFFARAYCPELTMGLLTQDEAIDIQPVSPPASAHCIGTAITSAKKDVVIKGECQAQDLLPNVQYRFAGEWKNHPKYGEQFAFSSFSTPETK